MEFEKDRSLNIDYDIYKNWYSREDVLYEIIKQLKARETMLIGFNKERTDEFIIRCLKIHSTEYLKSNFNAFNFFERYYNIYRSVALLQDMPAFSFNMKERLQQQDTFNREFMKYVTGYDFVIDFDGDNVSYDHLWQEVYIVKDLFDDYGVSYILKASSSKGFHIEIPDRFLVGDIKEKLLFSIKFAGQ
jgi:hypothetical protein